MLLTDSSHDLRRLPSIFRPKVLLVKSRKWLGHATPYLRLTSKEPVHGKALFLEKEQSDYLKRIHMGFCPLGLAE